MDNIDREKVFWREVDGEMVILNIESGFYYSLDETASFIWSRLAGGQSPENIVDDMVKVYEVSVATAQKDLEIFLEYFRKESLIR